MHGESTAVVAVVADDSLPPPVGNSGKKGTHCDGRQGIGYQHGGGGGGNGSTVDAVVGGGGRRPWRVAMPKVARRGRQRRTAAQAMAAAAGWPASLLAVTWIKILIWR